MEIGRIQVEIASKEQQIKTHNDGIRQAFEGQEAALKKGVTGQEARFHPYFVDGKRAHITFIQNEINDLCERRDQKFEELKYLRADVKVIDEMKTKDAKAYKKKNDKKMNEEIEEQVQNWRQIVR
jgi:citrate synthase